MSLPPVLDLFVPDSNFWSIDLLLFIRINFQFINRGSWITGVWLRYLKVLLDLRTFCLSTLINSIVSCFVLSAFLSSCIISSAHFLVYQFILWIDLNLNLWWFWSLWLRFCLNVGWLRLVGWLWSRLFVILFSRQLFWDIPCVFIVLRRRLRGLLLWSNYPPLLALLGHIFSPFYKITISSDYPGSFCITRHYLRFNCLNFLIQGILSVVKLLATNINDTDVL